MGYFCEQNTDNFRIAISIIYYILYIIPGGISRKKPYIIYNFQSALEHTFHEIIFSSKYTSHEILYVLRNKKFILSYNLSVQNLTQPQKSSIIELVREKYKLPIVYVRRIQKSYPRSLMPYVLE